MRETLYLGTSIISYYTGRPSRDLIVLAHQEITWDCSHIANVRIRRKLENINERYGLHTPLICTPIELEGGYDFVERPDS